MLKDKKLGDLFRDHPIGLGSVLLVVGLIGMGAGAAVVAWLPFFAGLAIVPWGVFKANRDKKQLAALTAQGLKPRLKMSFFDKKDQDAPAFMHRAMRVFGNKIPIYWTGRDGEPFTNYVGPLHPGDQLAVEMAFYTLLYSALWERSKRGFAITDAKNDQIWPELTDEGYIVEKAENDDGSIDAVVCHDVYGPVDRAEYENARKFDLGGWSKRFKRLSAVNGEEAYIPVCKPELKVIRLREPQAVDNPFRPRSIEKGAAQFAWVDEIATSPSVTPFTEDNPLTGAMLGAFDASVWIEGDERYANIFTKGEGHRIIIGPPGSGKFTAAIAPLLLSADRASVFVFDVANGEAARVTASYRATLGPVLVLDPFGVSGLPSGALNPLDFIKADDPDILQAAKRLTDALFVAKGGDSKDEYFNEQARDVLTAYLLHVATGANETDRTLRRVREIIRRPITSELLADMVANPVAGGMVADTAHNLIEAVKSDAEKNTFYVTQTLRANTAFLDLPAVIRATEKTTMDPAALRQGVATMYVCLPEAELAQLGRWLRLTYTTVMEKVRVKTDVPLHVVIDEFPALGRFPRVKDDMALVRKFGIHIHIATQSLAQLDGVYERDWQAFMAAAKYQQVFGVNDQLTAEYISKRLGKTTRRSTSSGQSRQQGGGSQSSGESWHAEDLMSPDELGRMDGEEQIILVEGMNPLRLQKLRYHNHSTFMERASLAGDAAA